jgi:uncharacterized membrane protein YhaH (DUF805 family)
MRRNDNMIEFYLNFWRRGLDFEGRSTRTEYWGMALIHFLFTIVMVTIVGISAYNHFVDMAYVTSNQIESFMNTHPITIVLLVYNLVAFIPSLSLVIRRLHDAGFSGWWYLLTLLSPIPLIGLIATIVLLVMLVSPSNPESEY